MYVGNDFHEDDYFYVNQGDGTFKEQLRSYFGHTSRFSMGNDVADLNFDGYPDLISLDMLPEDETVIKSSEGDDMPQTLKLRTEEYGYHYQFSRNMLFLSEPNAPYLETALLSGVSATDWSWSALFADYDLDGIQDLFISNGIPKRPNNLDYINFISNSQIQSQLNTSRLVDQKAIEMMPSGEVPNYFFKGQKGIQFENVSNTWTTPLPSLSGASALADLDNDGDLDIVSNNINATPTIYINSSSNKGNFLNIKLKYSAENPAGLGTKVYCYRNGKFQYKELYLSHGFQATSEAIVNFGLGEQTQIDSLVIIWPNKTKEVLPLLGSNQTLEIETKNTVVYAYSTSETQPIFRKTENNLGIDFIHQEDNHSDFNYQKLIPYQVSDRGPALAIGDLNLDGEKDIFIGGAKNQKAGLFVKTETGFEQVFYPEIDNDSLAEDVAAKITTPTFSKNPNINVLSGGNAITSSLKNLEDRWYLFNEEWHKIPVAYEIYENGSVIISNEKHTFFGNHSIPLSFGSQAHSMTYDSRGNQIIFENRGFVTDALFTDFNNDGIQDLIVVGEWMPPRFYELKEGTWQESFPLKENLNGLWQRIHPFDIDEDGDLDYLLGNWGTNTKFKAKETAPMKMYYADFDTNGTTETVVALEKNGKYYPLLGLNELASQMVFLRKKFNTYKDFAGKTIEEIFEDKLDLATVFEVHTLASGYLENNNGTFQFKTFDDRLQLSPLKAFCTFDFDNDGEEEVLTGGNYFGVIPFHGRFDSFPGALIKTHNKTELIASLGLNFSHKSVRHLAIIHHKENPYLLVIYNNDKTEVYEITS